MMNSFVEEYSQRSTEIDDNIHSFLLSNSSLMESLSSTASNSVRCRYRKRKGNRGKRQLRSKRTAGNQRMRLTGCFGEVQYAESAMTTSELIRQVRYSNNFTELSAQRCCFMSPISVYKRASCIIRKCCVDILQQQRTNVRLKEPVRSLYSRRNLSIEKHSTMQDVPSESDVVKILLVDIA
jgi:hypothetical protein